ncbi:DUF4384 domain-containing protein [Candidatus Eisenbacteria bacterium]|uniref:DUF4384 domain-containing protein n=1 Tax=Eiseniibacteriota bacterium TaxID=2212470 RepID=A0ABV6YPX7_UNCEI
MLKRLLLMMSVLAVASGSALGPTVAQAGLVSAGGHPGGGNPHLVGGSQMVSDQPFVEIWTDRGTGSVYVPGERVDVFMQPAYDCFVIVYDIDTDGNLRLLFPYDSRDDGFVRGGEIYRLGMGRSGGYRVTGPSGVEYVHVLSSFEPFRPVYWHGQAGYASYAHDATWRGFSDYWGAAVPPRVFGDPYVAMQSINEFICYDALEAGIAFADFTYFYVEHRVSYPRYLCYDCHGYQPAFHPYVDTCGGFHISFVACDPSYKPCSWWWWCSPKRVYCGPSYVCYSKKTCKSSCKGSCGNSCKNTKPSHKWRTRSDSYGGTGGKTSYADYYKERVRPGGSGFGGGRTAEVVRVRPEREQRPDGNTGERDLYSRKSSREAVRNTRPDGSRPEVETTRPKVRTTQPTTKTTRPEVRTMPARVERSKVDGRKADVPRVESRKVKKESGWSKLVKVVKTTIERESGRSKDSKSSRDSKTTRASDGKSGKKESDPKSAPRTVKVQASSEKKSSQSSESRKDARKARTTSTRSSQPTRRRVSD